MGKETRIEYCDSTINPVVGCPGCELFSEDAEKNHCYAATLVRRWAGWTGWPETFLKPAMFPGRLEKAIAWPDLRGQPRPDKPWLDGRRRVIFVNDLGDGFSPASPHPDKWLLPEMLAMRGTPHVWLFLSKWPVHMMRFFEKYPMPHRAWLGTTITGQNTINRVFPLLMDITSLPNRWLSIEPLLGPVTLPKEAKGKIGWVAAGGESGHNARPTHPDWARSLRDQCADMEIPFFWKQWGEWHPTDGKVGQALSGKAIDGKEHTEMFKEAK